MQNVNEVNLVYLIWPLINDICKNKLFRRCLSINNGLLDILISWINGNTFYKILCLAQEKDIKQNLRNREVDYDIYSIIDLCENCFAYDIALLIGAIIDLSENLNDADISKLQNLQKRIKYGLPNSLAIDLFEIGFADRVVAIELANCITINNPTKRNIKNLLLNHKEKVLSVIDVYPRYFKKQFLNMFEDDNSLSS